MACILLSSKSADGSLGVEGAEIPLKKLHKFSGYIFSNSDIAKAEMKILEALSYRIEFG